MARRPIPLTPAQRPQWEQFWAAYPRKDGKATAEVKFASTLQAGVDAEFLIRAAAALATETRSRGLDMMYVPYAATWLNQRRYEDDQYQPLRAAPQATQPKASAEEAPPPWWPELQATGMDRLTYEQWIAPCRIEIVTEDHPRPGTRIARITAPSAFVGDWIVQRLSVPICTALRVQTVRIER